ncbi:MAG TPA: hypothetical protein VF510_11795 [Ktedonobacterales bacterium]
MAEAREPSTTRDTDHLAPNGSLRDAGSQSQRAAESTEKNNLGAAPDVPRGPNTPDSLEQPHDLGDVPAETGIHMHPASLTLPEQDLDMTEGDEPTIP